MFNRFIFHPRQLLTINKLISDGASADGDQGKFEKIQKNWKQNLREDQLQFINKPKKSLLKVSGNQTLDGGYHGNFFHPKFSPKYGHALETLLKIPIGMLMLYLIEKEGQPLTRDGVHELATLLENKWIQKNMRYCQSCSALYDQKLSVIHVIDKSLSTKELTRTYERLVSIYYSQGQNLCIGLVK
jgi:hypothetical protein